MTCYICMADEEEGSAAGELLSEVCACTDRAVHAACLVRWIERSGETCCGVCKEELRGLSVTKKVTANARATRLASLFVWMGTLAVPMYFTCFLIRNALRSGSFGSLAVSIFLMMYQCGFCACVVWSWLRSPPQVVHRVHVELPELRV